jgi:hypothetical protein
MLVWKHLENALNAGSIQPDAISTAILGSRANRNTLDRNIRKGGAIITLTKLLRMQIASRHCRLESEISASSAMSADTPQ